MKKMIWKRKQKKMPKPANMQNQCRAGSTVEEPMRKARQSVSEVMKIDMPPERMAFEICASIPPNVCFDKAGR